MNKNSKDKLINQIKLLKEIKPNGEWVVLTKEKILGLSNKDISETLIIERSAKKLSFFEIIKFLSWQRKLAYCSLLSLFIIIGLIGFANQTMPGDLLFPVKKIVEKSEVSLLGYTDLRQNLTLLNYRINELEKAAKEGKSDKIPAVVNEVKNQASQLAKNLKEKKTEKPEELKEIALSLKTLAYVPGTDLSENPEMQDLYKIVIENQIADLEKATLTEKDQILLLKAKELFNEGKYLQSLELILKIGENGRGEKELFNKKEEENNIQNQDQGLEEEILKGNETETEKNQEE